MSIHENRDRALSFGDDAHQYDRTRPSYPPALVDDLMADSPERVLDVGCGTGIVGRLFLARGCHVVGIEPDARMAEVARSHGLEVEDGTFEQWDARGRRFDLLVSGQAWHWVDPAVGPRKAAEVLEPGGRLAVFWNNPRHEPDTKAALDAAYDRHAPELRRHSNVLGTLRVARDQDADPIAATGLFEEPERRSYEWEVRYTRDQWLDQLPTHSDHRLLDPDRRARLLDAIAGVIDGLGGSLVVHYRTGMLTARVH